MNAPNAKVRPIGATGGLVKSGGGQRVAVRLDHPGSAKAHATVTNQQFTR